jgi:hypothetical protein
MSTFASPYAALGNDYRILRSFFGRQLPHFGNDLRK